MPSSIRYAINVGIIISRIDSMVTYIGASMVSFLYSFMLDRSFLIMAFFLFLFMMLLLFDSDSINQSEHGSIFELIRRHIGNHSFQKAAEFFTLRRAESFKHSHVQRIERRPAFPGRS